MAQLISITSEALQSTIRRLLPSQQGFGEDLQATNVVTPIIDLTPTAEGSNIPQYMQTSLAFGSNTFASAKNETTSLTLTGGFWRILGTICIEQTSGSINEGKLQIRDSAGSTKDLFIGQCPPGSAESIFNLPFDLTVFIRPQDDIKLYSSGTDVSVFVSYRQVADSTGNLVNPSGFSPE